MTVTPGQAPAPRASFVERVIQWLRAGYPEGVPQQDYVVLLGLLRRKLTDAEVTRIAGLLAAGQPDSASPIDRAQIEDAIGRSVLQEPSGEDVARVSARLAAGGWPLADPPGPTPGVTIS